MARRGVRSGAGGWVCLVVGSGERDGDVEGTVRWFKRRISMMQGVSRNNIAEGKPATAAETPERMRDVVVGSAMLGVKFVLLFGGRGEGLDIEIDIDMGG